MIASADRHRGLAERDAVRNDGHPPAIGVVALARRRDRRAQADRSAPSRTLTGCRAGVPAPPAPMGPCRVEQLQCLRVRRVQVELPRHGGPSAPARRRRQCRRVAGFGHGFELKHVGGPPVDLPARRDVHGVWRWSSAPLPRCRSHCPMLARDLEASQAELTCIVNAYSVVFAAVLLPFGIAADRFCRRLALLLGLTIFGLASCVVRAPGPIRRSWPRCARLPVSRGRACSRRRSRRSVDAFPPERRARAVSVWAGVSGRRHDLHADRRRNARGLRLAGIQVVFGVLALALLVPVARFVYHSRNPRLSLDPFGCLLAVHRRSRRWFSASSKPATARSVTRRRRSASCRRRGLLGFVAWQLRTDTPMLERAVVPQPGPVPRAARDPPSVLRRLRLASSSPRSTRRSCQGYSATGDRRRVPAAHRPVSAARHAVRVTDRWRARARWLGTADAMALVATAFLGLAP